MDTWSAETFWSELAGVPQRRRYLAIEVEGEFAGYAGLAIAAPDCDIQTVAIEPSWQGNRLGERLLIEALAIAVERGCSTCHLEVRSDNQAALKLYAKHGFAEVAVRKGYYEGKADAIVMAAPIGVSA